MAPGALTCKDLGGIISHQCAVRTAKMVPGALTCKDLGEIFPPVVCAVRKARRCSPRPRRPGNPLLNILQVEHADAGDLGFRGEVLCHLQIAVLAEGSHAVASGNSRQLCGVLMGIDGGA